MLEVPATFGKYLLTERLATGGMAEIYLAKLIGPGGFEKQLVIKQILPGLASDRFLDLFVAEAKTLVSLTHGNIVPIYELGVIEDQYFIAMEYIDGPTLARLAFSLSRRHEVLGANLAAYVCAELLKGLDYAHRKADGIIHRDLSPRNVMVSREGEVKIVDFGLAVALSDADAATARNRAGSLPYMSPEQARGETLDARSDLFSAGVLLWELVTGSVLFARDSAPATLEAVLSEPIPPPSSLREAIPQAIDDACARALARRRDERYATAAEFLADLNRYLYSLATPATAPALSRIVARVCPPEARPPETGAREPAGKARERSPGVHATRPMAGRRRPHTAPVTRSFAARADLAALLTDTPADAQAPAPAPGDAAPGDDERQRAAARAGRANHGAGDAAPTPAPAPRRRLIPIAVTAGTLVVAATILAVAITSLRHHPPAAPRRAAGKAAAIFGRAPSRAGAAADPGTLTGRTGGVLGADADDAAAARAATPPPPTPADATSAHARRATVARRRRSGRPAPPARPPGLLKVGANPWADVYLDSQKLGRAPGAWKVPSGPHSVEVVFPVPGHKQRRAFRITVPPGGTRSLGVVDFTGD